MDGRSPPPGQEKDGGGDEGSGDGGARSMWRHLQLLVRADSKESVEYILQSLWRTRSTGLDSADRAIFREMLQLQSDSALDPLLLCLRMLIRKCAIGDVRRDEIQTLFPEEVTPELRRLLTLLLQRFQSEWREDAGKDKVSIPRLKAVTWNMLDQNGESGGSVPAITLKLEAGGQALSKDSEVKIQLTQETLQTMLKSMFCIRDQLSSAVGVPTGPQERDDAQ
ncbi:uncharacterized protein LOC144705946 [Wolffia australiana]